MAPTMGREILGAAPPTFPQWSSVCAVCFLPLVISGGHLAAGSRLRAAEDSEGDRGLDESGSGSAAETRGDREPAQCNATHTSSFKLSSALINRIWGLGLNTDLRTVLSLMHPASRNKFTANAFHMSLFIQRHNKKSQRVRLCFWVQPLMLPSSLSISMGISW